MVFLDRLSVSEAKRLGAAVIEPAEFDLGAGLHYFLSAS